VKEVWRLATKEHKRAQKIFGQDGLDGLDGFLALQGRDVHNRRCSEAKPPDWAVLSHKAPQGRDYHGVVNGGGVCRP
jgi:hypothetical protein